MLSTSKRIAIWNIDYDATLYFTKSISSMTAHSVNSMDSVLESEIKDLNADRNRLQIEFESVGQKLKEQIRVSEDLEMKWESAKRANGDLSEMLTQEMERNQRRLLLLNEVIGQKMNLHEINKVLNEKVLEMETTIDRLRSTQNTENREYDDEQKEMSPVNEESTSSMESMDTVDDESANLMAESEEQRTSALTGRWRIPAHSQILHFLSFLASIWMRNVTRPITGRAT